MNQRAAAAGRGRPSGTDGSDFSFRMVVDSSTKPFSTFIFLLFFVNLSSCLFICKSSVRIHESCKAKSRLAKFIFAQVVAQLMIAANVFVSVSKKETPDQISASSLAIGLVSIVAGELGRRRSRSNFLKFYVFGSSMAILLSVAYLAMSNLTLEVFQNFTSLETLKTAAVFLGLVVQLSAIAKTISLIKNMAPPKRAS